MKKVLSLLLVVLLICSITACGSEKNGVNENPEVTEKGTVQNETVSVAISDTEPATEAAAIVTEPATVPAEVVTEPAVTEAAKDTNSIDPDFKAAMDSYEKFFDEYVAIMKKYKENPMDMSILADYGKYMGQYAEMMQNFEKWENEDLNAAETAYYVDVQARITKKLLEVAY